MTGIIFIVAAAVVLTAAAAFFALLSRAEVPEAALCALDGAGITRKELYAVLDAAAGEGTEEEEQIDTLLRTGAAVDGVIGEEKFSRFLYLLGNPLEKRRGKAFLVLKYSNPSKKAEFETVKEKLDPDNTLFDDFPALTLGEAQALSKGILGACRALEGLDAGERQKMFGALEKISSAENILDVSYKDFARAANLIGTAAQPILECQIGDFLAGVQKYYPLPFDTGRTAQIADAAPNTFAALAQLLKTLEASDVMERFAEAKGFAGREAEYALCAAIKMFFESGAAALQEAVIINELNGLGELLASFGIVHTGNLGDFAHGVAGSYPALTEEQLAKAEYLLELVQRV